MATNATSSLSKTPKSERNRDEDNNRDKRMRRVKSQENEAGFEGGGA